MLFRDFVASAFKTQLCTKLTLDTSNLASAIYNTSSSDLECPT